MAGGTLIVCVAMTAWAVLLFWSWSMRAWPTLALLLVPLGGLAAQLFYSHVYPIDWLGMVKGAYVLYAMPPLFATFGLGVAWLHRRTVWLTMPPLAALCGVAAYTIWCRVI